jgi:hypothetical protein
MSQASKKWPTVYGTRKFPTIFEGAWSFIAFSYMLIVISSSLTELDDHSDFCDLFQYTCSCSTCVEIFFLIRAISPR